ncbi:DUF732 domain-containing protein [Williamsia sp.]|uniref:DUF732 domain-containing protein n=1 Tax=Williamsia sp. TaxID=1872085 RepID=UPI002F91EC08
MKKLVALVSFVSCMLFAAACSSEDIDKATSAVRSSAERAMDNVSTAAGDVQDNAYTEALQSQDASFGTREEQIAAARTACDDLSGGTSLNDTVTSTADSTGLSDSKARTLINIGVPIYCPSNVGKLAGN